MWMWIIFLICRSGGQVLVERGLWDKWNSGSGRRVTTQTTLPPSPALMIIHNQLSPLLSQPLTGNSHVLRTIRSLREARWYRLGSKESLAKFSLADQQLPSFYSAVKQVVGNVSQLVSITTEIFSQQHVGHHTNAQWTSLWHYWHFAQCAMLRQL